MNGWMKASLAAAAVCAAGLVPGVVSAAQSKPGPAAKQRTTAVAACKVSGKVVDVVTKKPVPKLRILVAIRAGTTNKVQYITTNAAGVYSVSVPKGATIAMVPLALDARPPRYLLDEMWLRSGRWGTAKVTRSMVVNRTVKLLAMRTVRVSVVDPAGRPAAKASVFAGPFSTVTGPNGVAEVRLAQTDANAAVFAMSAAQDGSGFARIASGDSDVRVQLQPRTTIRGRAVDTEGRPAAGLSLVVFPDVRIENYKLGDRLVSALRTNEQGTYELKGFVAESYRLYWDSSGGYKRGDAIVKLINGQLEPITVARKQLDPAAMAGSVCLKPETKVHEPSCFAVDGDDNLIVCDAARTKLLKVSPEDRLLAAWTTPFRPEAVDVRSDGAILVGGDGQVAVLNPDGTVRTTGKLPSRRPVSAITHSGSDVFVCVQGQTGFAVYRMKDNLKEPQRIISNLSGCCGQMDIRAHGGFLYAAENTRFAIGKYALDGKLIARYVHSDSRKPEYYGEGCCEPKNLCFAPDGTILTAASGKMEVKRYAPDGKFLGAVGALPDADGSCVRVTLGVSKGGKRIYILDTANSVVRMLKRQ
jgi:sugar lactone lactonase YvrE